MKHRLSTQPSGNVLSSPRSFGSKAAVVGVAIAMVAGSAILSSGAANAAPDFTVTTPSAGATAVAQTFPNVVAFAGANLPTGDTASVSYVDENAVSHNATFAGSESDSSGNWTGNENFSQLSTGQTSVIATVSALDSTGAVDASVVPVTVAFTLAVAPNPFTPFTVTAPESNSTTPVASTTPTFSGTGNPGATIKITYAARAAGEATAATATVAEDGTWNTTTDFSQLEPGSIDGSAIVTELGADGNPFPNTSGVRVNFTFPTAPVAAIPLTLVVSPKSSTVAAATTSGINFAATGFSPGEQVSIVVTDPSGAAVALTKAEANFYASSTDGSVAALAILPSATAGTYNIAVTGLRSARAVTATFAVTANPATANPVVPTTGTLPVVSG